MAPSSSKDELRQVEPAPARLAKLRDQLKLLADYL
jgi:hypothetical protein